MVEYSLSLDSVFGSLSDATRRDILHRLIDSQMTVNQIARPYALSLAAISKHLKVLEKARLITKRKRGNQYVVQLAPRALADIDAYLNEYRKLWEERFDALETLLQEEQSNKVQELPWPTPKN